MFKVLEENFKNDGSFMIMKDIQYSDLASLIPTSLTSLVKFNTSLGPKSSTKSTI